MLTEIGFYGVQSSAAAVALGVGPEATDPIQIKKIDGLGPVKADINSAPYGAANGEFFIGSSVGKRNIVITFGLNPNWVDQTMESLRAQLYAYLMPQLPIRLTFSSTHLPDVEISGIVESFEPNMFSKDPEIQVSVVCLQPNFTAITPTVFTGTTFEAATHVYTGTLPTGFEFRTNRNNTAGAGDGVVSLTNFSPFQEQFQVGVNYGPDGALYISTVDGNKYAKNISSTNVETNYLGNLVPGSIWLKLKPGTNVFSAKTTLPYEFGGPSPPGSWSWQVKYTAQYGGL